MCRWAIGRSVFILGVFTLPLGAIADEPIQALPEPLSLEFALSLADDDHPSLVIANAAIERAKAEQTLVSSINDVRVDLELAARVIEPSDNTLLQDHNDSWAKLRVRKRLYDFGLTQRTEAASESQLMGHQWARTHVRQNRRVEIMSRFFDVLLMDLENSRDTEAMSMAFIRLNKARNRSELGQLSDVRLFKLESTYQAALRTQRQSEAGQRASRARLAASLNRPGELPSSLDVPVLNVLSRKVGDVDEWIQQALSDNPKLNTLRQHVQAEEQRLQAAKLQSRPVLHGQFEAGEYHREMGGRSPVVAGLVLEVPLYQGRKVDAKAAIHRAEARRYRAVLAQEELKISQSILDLWLELGTLEHRQNELDMLGDYRELYLDRSRALYEMEVTSDLGDAMVQSSDLRLQKAENEYKLALAWARLDALTGQLVKSEELY